MILPALLAGQLRTLSEFSRETERYVVLWVLCKKGASKQNS